MSVFWLNNEKIDTAFQQGGWPVERLIWIAILVVAMLVVDEHGKQEMRSVETSQMAGMQDLTWRGQIELTRANETMDAWRTVAMQCLTQTPTEQVPGIMLAREKISGQLAIFILFFYFDLLQCLNP